MNEDVIREQIVAQCRAVEHLATALAKVHSDFAMIVETGFGVLDIVGPRTARLMEILGNALNEMDAGSDEDRAFGRVFKEAQRLFPQAGDQQ